MPFLVVVVTELRGVPEENARQGARFSGRGTM
jgi:hypothetical protein